MFSILIIIKTDKFQTTEEELWHRTHKKGHNEDILYIYIDICYTWTLSFISEEGDSMFYETLVSSYKTARYQYLEDRKCERNPS